jgi:hypothetical protein
MSDTRDFKRTVENYILTPNTLADIAQKTGRSHFELEVMMMNADTKNQEIRFRVETLVQEYRQPKGF